MADIRERILDRYGIDIAQENVLKLYKIENVDLSDQELQTQIDMTRKRWNQSINGANERNAERDRARLEKAQAYEAILRDKKLRKELAQYYANGGKSGRNSTGPDVLPGSVDFAREYFQLVQTTKILNRRDVDFFFDYYRDQRKNKRAICEMLEKEFKLRGLKGDEDEKDAEDAADQEGRKKDDSSSLIVNLFQKQTILKLRKCNVFYTEACQSEEVNRRFPELREGLYEFLNLKKLKTVEEFAQMTETRGKEMYALRQEKGTEYMPLVDLFNTLQCLAQYRDVVDNYPEFCLLIRYPNLSPYMFAFSKMKKETLKKFRQTAEKDYVFRDETDFLLSYYIPVREHFDVMDGEIAAIVKKAAKKAKQNKILNEIEERAGKKKKNAFPFSARVVYALAYWPIFLVYLLFEIIRVIFNVLDRFKFIVFILAFFAVDAGMAQVVTAFLRNLTKPDFPAWRSLVQILTDLTTPEGRLVLGEYLGVSAGKNTWGLIYNAVGICLMNAGMDVAVLVLIGNILREFRSDSDFTLDWTGYRRTFKNIFAMMREQADQQFRQYRKRYFKQKSMQAICNFCFLVVLLVVGFFGIGKLREVNDQIQDVREEIVNEARGVEETDTSETGTSETEAEEQEDVLLTVTADTANVRTGPGTDYEAFTTIAGGETYVATGNQSVAANGSTWYEIYLDEERTETGWASEKVITPVE